MYRNIVIPTSYHFSLKENVESNKYFQDLLLSMVLFDGAYFYEYLINEKNHSVYDKLKKHGLIKNVPLSYVKKNLDYLNDVFSAYSDMHMLDREYLDFTYSFENLENRKYIKELSNIDNEYIINRDNIEFKLNIFKNNASNLFSFINAYRRNQKIIPEYLTNDFRMLTTIESLISCISTSVEIELEMLKNNNNDGFNFNNIISSFYDYYDDFVEMMEYEILWKDKINTLYGNYYSISKIPNKSYINNYFNLIESNVLFNASLDFSLDENVILKMPQYFNYEQVQNYENKYLNKNDSYFQIYKLLIEDINFPILNNVDDLMKFKEHKHLKEFKKLMYEWNDAILNDEYSALKNIKKYIKKVNDKFKYFDKVKRTDIDFFIAIPFAIIDLIFKTPTSLIPLAITSYLKIDEFITTKKYRGLIWK